MKREFRIAGESIELDIRLQGGQVQFSRAGQDVTAHASIVEAEPGFYSLLVEGVSYRVRLFEVGGRWEAHVNGRTMEAEVVDPRAAGPARRGAGTQGQQVVRAPMPGKVVRILVAAGSGVEAGQGIAVMEAMKMQNELKAPKAGHVIQVPVQAGTTVAAGDVIAIIE